MAGLQLLFWRAVTRWLMTGILGLAAGCASQQPAPPISLPVHAPVLAVEQALVTPEPAPAAALPAPTVADAPAAAPAAAFSMSRLAELMAGRFRKPAEPPEASAPVSPPVPVDETLSAPGDTTDQKYRFTADDAREVQRGRASWYGGQFHGRRTANGETFDKYALTAAHKTLPFGTIVRVRSETLGREVDVRINDRGPFAPGRVIDLSQAAAEVLGLMGAGVTEVSLKVGSRQGKAALPLTARKKIWRRAPAKPADPYRH
ncbi:MAG: rare lipoprotein [Polaromonas sp.]|nr:rare lipoprotein [Polaromonas sp.]